jgi:hypothetical protein
MESQLRLLTAEHRSADTPEAHAWRIDESTRAVGRSGLALARQALAQARRPLPQHTTTEGQHHPAAA